MEERNSEVTIDGLEFKFHHIPVDVLNNTLMKIIKLVGKPIGEASQSYSSNESAERKEGMIAEIIEAISQSIDEKTINEISNIMLKNTLCVGEGLLKDPVIIDKVFRRKLLTYWKVVGAALDYHFGDFFAEGLGLLGNLKLQGSILDI